MGHAGSGKAYRALVQRSSLNAHGTVAVDVAGKPMAPAMERYHGWHRDTPAWHHVLTQGGPMD